MLLEYSEAKHPGPFRMESPVHQLGWGTLGEAGGDQDAGVQDQPPDQGVLRQVAVLSHN
jgi:hypothetical protein